MFIIIKRSIALSNEHGHLNFCFDYLISFSFSHKEWGNVWSSLLWLNILVFFSANMPLTVALPLCSILKSIQHSLQYAWNLLAELGPRVSNVEVHSVLKVDEYFFLFTFIPVIPSVCWALVSIAVRAWLQSCPRLPPPQVIWAIGVRSKFASL